MNINEVIENMVNEIKEELLGEEVTLLEMDNKVLDILESHGNETNRSFCEGPTREYIENKGFAYRIHIEELDDNVNHDVWVGLEVVEDDKDILEVLVKITEVEEI